jgi:hypothetical protein
MQAELKNLKVREERLTRAMRAMIEILETKLGVKSSDILDVVKRMEAEERGPGGVTTKLAKQCTNCERPIQENSSTCIYCGSEVETPIV